MSKKIRYDLLHLLALVYAENNHHTKVVVLKEAQDLKVDLVKGTWTYEGKTRKIGQSRVCKRNNRYGILFVFDDDNIIHMNKLISVAKRATN